VARVFTWAFLREYGSFKLWASGGVSCALCYEIIWYRRPFVSVPGSIISRATIPTFISFAYYVRPKTISHKDRLPRHVSSVQDVRTTGTITDLGICTYFFLWEI
jgi:hypothetical protein